MTTISRRDALALLAALPFAARVDAQSRPAPRVKVLHSYSHGLLLEPGGTLKAWLVQDRPNGSPWLGLGNDRAMPAHTLVAVPGLTNVVAAAAGRGCTFAVLADGRLLAWGWNSEGMLGTTRLADLEVTASWAPHSNVPIPLAVKFDAVSVATLDDHVLALARDGSVYAWGRGHLGQLGIGPRPIIKFKSHGASAMKYVPFPVRVPDLTGVTAISAGRAHSLALLNDGTVRAWGSNTNGQVGDGTKINRERPVLVEGVRNAVSIATGTDSSFAVLTNGTVMAWGGQWGGLPDLLRPTLVAGAQGIRSIAAGVAHVAALTESGTVLTWGDNTYHQLARGNRPSQGPGVIKELNGVQSIAAIASLTTAVLESGRILAWGGGVREWTRPQAGMSIVAETPILLWVDGLDQP